jgi:hypothetical protein
VEYAGVFGDREVSLPSPWGPDKLALAVRRAKPNFAQYSSARSGKGECSVCLPLVNWPLYPAARRKPPAIKTRTSRWIAFANWR